MKKIIALIALCNIMLSVGAQTINLDECQNLARENYPALRQLDLVDRANRYTIENARTAYLPQVSLSAQGTYQNAVSEFPDEMQALYTKMGINMKGLNKDQYKIGVDVNQIIWDGGATKSKNQITQATSETEKQQIEVELYQLKDRVNALYFGILLLEAQERQNLNMQDCYRAIATRFRR
jgi:outer membrane protein TolC